MRVGRYTRDFFILPSIMIHLGDGIYTTVELSWLRWYITLCFHPDK